jgi:hypothetical protein
LRPLLEILGEILGKPPNRANIAATLAPPALVRIGEFVPTRDEDDEVIVHRPPLLELCHPEIDEPPTAPLIIAPQGIQEARDIPTIPAMRRSVSEGDAGGVIPSDPSRDEMMPRPEPPTKPLETPYTVIGLCDHGPITSIAHLTSTWGRRSERLPILLITPLNPSTHNPRMTCYSITSSSPR